MGEKGSFGGRNLWRRPQEHRNGDSKVIGIRVSNPRDLDGPWNDNELISRLTNGDAFFDPLWQEALIQAGTIPDYFVAGSAKDKFMRDIRNFGSFIDIARRGIHGRPSPIEDSGENLEALNIGYKVGATIAADKTVKKISTDARSRVNGEKIRFFEDLANKQFFNKIALSKRGITLRDVLNPDQLIESSGVAQWYRFISDCQRTMVNPIQNGSHETGEPTLDPFLDMAAAVMLLSLTDAKIFNQPGSREFKAAGREAHAITTNLQGLRSRTLDAFLDKDHPEHLGVIEAVSQTLNSEDPRIRRATMIYLRGDTMPIEVYRAAESALAGATGLEANTLRNLMDEIDLAIHEKFPDHIVAAREFPMITNAELKGGFGTDMITLQRKATALLKLTGPFERDFLPENFKWGDFKKPKGTKFSILKSRNNGHLVSFEMTFETEQGDKSLHVLLDPNKGIIDFRNILSITEEQADFVGSYFYLLSRVMDRVNTDLRGQKQKSSSIDVAILPEETVQRPRSRRVKPIQTEWTADSSTNTGRPETSRTPKLVRVLEYGTDEEMEAFYSTMTPENAEVVRRTLKELESGGLERLKTLVHEDKFSPNGNRQFEDRIGGVDGGNMGIRIIFEQIRGEAGVLKYKPRKMVMKSEWKRPGSARSRNYRSR